MASSTASALHPLLSAKHAAPAYEKRGGKTRLSQREEQEGSAQLTTSVCGDSYPLGCRFDPHIFGAQFFLANPDKRRRMYQTQEYLFLVPVHCSVVQCGGDALSCQIVRRYIALMCHEGPDGPRATCEELVPDNAGGPPKRCDEFGTVNRLLSERPSYTVKDGQRCNV
ncbi:hypothetical protein V8C86DRAFT_3029665 [Haematococcus lacustris]